MILIDPELDLGPSRQLRGLSQLPLVGDAGSRPSPVDASPRTKWRRSALPWAERVPTPQTLSRFLAQAQTAIGLRGQVTVLLTSDAAVRDLNRRFRGKNKPTDVLSFPSTNPAFGPEKMAGDLAISVETARRQAVEQGLAGGLGIATGQQTIERGVDSLRGGHQFRCLRLPWPKPAIFGWGGGDRRQQRLQARPDTSRQVSQFRYVALPQAV